MILVIQRLPARRLLANFSSMSAQRELTPALRRLAPAFTMNRGGRCYPCEMCGVKIVWSTKRSTAFRIILHIPPHTVWQVDAETRVHSVFLDGAIISCVYEPFLTDETPLISAFSVPHRFSLDSNTILVSSIVIGLTRKPVVCNIGWKVLARFPGECVIYPNKANVEIRFGHGVVGNFNPVNGLKIANMWKINEVMRTTHLY